MTSDQHQSGTNRIAEAVSKLGFDDDEVIVNVQGDEYGIQSRIINTVAQVLHKTPAADIATLCEQIHERKTYEDVNSVKVVLDADNFALYFSRSPVPWSGDKNGPVYLPAYKHIGIYAYRSGFIRNFSKLARTALEQQESLEQLRALFFGQKIFVEKIAEKEGIEINTEEDLIRARSLI
jgi:3-deoxy-manno-octulosonate cytidylyltransferase (CMP-KDO synthetase)